MDQWEASILATAEIILDAVALTEAVREDNCEEAAFRAHLVAKAASASGYKDVELAAQHLIDLLEARQRPSTSLLVQATHDLSLLIDETKGVRDLWRPKGL